MRKPRPTFERLLQLLYASVLQAEQLPAFMHALCARMNAHLAALQADDVSHVHNPLAHFSESDVGDFGAPSADPYENIWLQRGAADLLAGGGVHDGEGLFTERELQERRPSTRRSCAPSTSAIR